MKKTASAGNAGNDKTENDDLMNDNSENDKVENDNGESNNGEFDRSVSREDIRKMAASFCPAGEIISCVSYGNGHINDTFKVDTGKGAFILQRINRHVFKNPADVMENLALVTGHMEKKLGFDEDLKGRRVLKIIRDHDGALFRKDPEGEYWRALEYIPGSVCLERAKSDAQFYEGALAFGSFQRMLSDFPISSLHETIPHFHDTPMRLDSFRKAVKADSMKRAREAGEEIEYLEKNAYLAPILRDAAAMGRLPLRVAHNDTKLNNVIFDRGSGHWICVLDLDTVMPGYSVTDFGDAIRFGASTAAEDEENPEKVHFDLHLYEIYKDGYLEGCGKSLLKSEEELLPWGAMVITYEQALRFLTDYLEGDHYYKTAKEKHNLIRARSQIKLLQEMKAVV